MGQKGKGPNLICFDSEAKSNAAAEKRGEKNLTAKTRRTPRWIRSNLFLSSNRSSRRNRKSYWHFWLRVPTAWRI